MFAFQEIATIIRTKTLETYDKSNPKVWTQALGCKYGPFFWVFNIINTYICMKKFWCWHSLNMENEMHHFG